MFNYYSTGFKVYVDPPSAANKINEAKNAFVK